MIWACAPIPAIP